MTSPIEFYFDFTSPFGFIGSQRIEEIANQHNRKIHWHPIVLGFIFKVTESRPLVELPLKGDYSLMDMARSAREYDIDMRMPTSFPVSTVGASRAVLWLQSQEQQGSSQQSTALIHALYKAYFVNDTDISKVDNLISIAQSVGVDGSQLSGALQDSTVKALLKEAVDTALAKQVFGSPFMIVDGEHFWGSDRLDQLDRWLDSGGW